MQNINGTTWYPQWSQGYQVPPLAPERLPAQCVGAPLQVGYYDIKSNVFYSSRAIYDELIATDPINLPYIAGAIFGELAPGAPMYAEGQMVVKPPEMPKREIDTSEQTPSVIGPSSATYANGDSRTVVDIEGTVTNVGTDPTAWRFTANKSSVSVDGFFEITAGGRIIALSGSVPIGSYSQGVQANWKGLWSKSLSVVIAVVA